MKVALIGQPNCGKSTLFNSVAGYRSETSNFPGSTVNVARGSVRLNGMLVELVDVPGIYSLTSSNPAERAAKHFLLDSQVDLIINVLDASLLSRSLELTLELRELGIPMVLCLNMSDEAEHKGIRISAAQLAEKLQVPVVATVAPRGVGVLELFAQARAHLGHPPAPSQDLLWSRDVERAIHRLESALPASSQAGSLPARFRAIKLLEADDDLGQELPSAACAAAQRLRDELGRARGRACEAVIMSERHDVAMRLSEQVAAVGRPRSDLREALDDLLTHPFWGYVFLAAALLAFFWAVFGVGAFIERAMQARLASLFPPLDARFTPGSLAEIIFRSLWDGFIGAVVIVLPYLIPFLLGLAFLEDVGYLPRVAYLMDGLLHRIGLHGTAMMPLILGYGCSVPACMATRILPSRRDRFLASVLATLVPCAARANVIFALVAFYLGPWWALSVFLFNAAVVILSGWLLTRLWPEITPGMVLDVPRYQWPRLGLMLRKVWFRTREFVVLGWPLLMAGSLVLGLAEYFHWDRYVNAGLSPLTRLLGLPAAVGTTLVFGVLRKELSLVMLVQALGTTHVRSVLSVTQILVFTLFVTFYFPCLATMAALLKEIGRKLTAAAVAYTFVLATALAVAARFLLGAILPH